MGEAERLQPCAEGFEKFAWVAGVAHGLRRQRLDGGKRVLHPMIQFAQQEALALLGGFAFADIVVDAEDQTGWPSASRSMTRPRDASQRGGSTCLTRYSPK